jgi:hypothetical protein
MQIFHSIDTRCKPLNQLSSTNPSAVAIPALTIHLIKDEREEERGREGGKMKTERSE